MNEISAFVLAGGKSLRMGKDKALLKIGSETLLARTLAVAMQLTNKVFVVGEKARLPEFGNVIEDGYRGCGPLAGIHAALSHSSTDRNLLLAVDMPFVTQELLGFLISTSNQSDAVVVVPRAGSRLQPLCAMYRKAFAEVAEQALKEGRHRIDPLFGRVPTRIIEEKELSAAGFFPNLFENVNTPADWERAQSRASQDV